MAGLRLVKKEKKSMRRQGSGMIDILLRTSARCSNRTSMRQGVFIHQCSADICCGGAVDIEGPYGKVIQLKRQVNTNNDRTGTIHDILLVFESILEIIIGWRI